MRVKYKLQCDKNIDKKSFQFKKSYHLKMYIFLFYAKKTSRSKVFVLHNPYHRLVIQPFKKPL